MRSRSTWRCVGNSSSWTLELSRGLSRVDDTPSALRPLATLSRADALKSRLLVLIMRRLCALILARIISADALALELWARTGRGRASPPPASGGSSSGGGGAEITAFEPNGSSCATFCSGSSMSLHLLDFILVAATSSIPSSSLELVATRLRRPNEPADSSRAAELMRRRRRIVHDLWPDASDSLLVSSKPSSRCCSATDLANSSPTPQWSKSAASRATVLLRLASLRRVLSSASVSVRASSGSSWRRYELPDSQLRRTAQLSSRVSTVVWWTEDCSRSE
mmetsp:Transcript_8546/g.20502  ORF Transcript_8546/g.20502 Transcript_8546/m.20502 type:complete len:280 (-) Transcript_8546:836-1675(-)